MPRLNSCLITGLCLSIAVTTPIWVLLLVYWPWRELFFNPFRDFPAYWVWLLFWSATLAPLLLLPLLLRRR